MEYKYDKARYNKTYYEKNKEKLRELQRQKRRKMKEALQKVEAEEQDTRTESQEPTEGLSNFFFTISSSFVIGGYSISCNSCLRETIKMLSALLRLI